MSDIVEQLQIAIPHPAPDVAMQDGIVAVNRANRERRAAAKEIACLRGDAEIARLRLEAAQGEIARLRLTDAERERLAWAATFIDENYAMGAGDTLRKMLERLACTATTAPGGTTRA